MHRIDSGRLRGGAKAAFLLFLYPSLSFGFVMYHLWKEEEQRKYYYYFLIKD